MRRPTTYQKRAAVIESFRRGHFLFAEVEDTKTRADLFINSDDLMEGQYAQHMAKPNRQFGAKMEKPCFPLIGTLVKDKAVAFKEGVVVELVDPATNMAVNADQVPVVAKLPAIMKGTGIIGAMDNANEWLVSHKTSSIQIRPDLVGRRLSCKALPSYCVEGTDSALYPGDPEYAARLVVPERGNAFPEDPDTERMISYEYKDGVFYAGLTDVDGVPLDETLPEAPDNVLRVQKHPVVVWKEYESDTLFNPLPKSLLNSQYGTNLTLAVVQLAFRVGAHGQPYLRKARDADPLPDQDVSRIIEEPPSTDTTSSTLVKVGNTNVSISGAMHELPVLPDGYEMDLLQSRIDPLVYMRYVESHIKLAYAAEGMVVSRIDIFNSQPSHVGMGAKLVEASPAEEDKQRRERRLSELAEKTLNVWRDYWNLVASPGDEIPEHLQFRVRFTNLWSPSLLTNQSFMQGLEIAATMGLIDPAEVLSSMKNISYEEAKVSVKSSAGLTKLLKEFQTQPSSTR
jgi:hypothetical protein